MGSGASKPNLMQQLHPQLLAAQKNGTAPRRGSKEERKSINRSRSGSLFGGGNVDARRGSNAGHANVQEEAASFRSKASTIKMMIKNQNSRVQFSQFLEKKGNGKEMLMEYYLHVDMVRKIKDPEQRRSQFLETVDKYQKLAEGKPQEAPENVILLSTHTWKDMKTLADDELLKHIGRSQDEVALALTPCFEDFMDSPEYKKISQEERAQEKRRFSTVSN